MQLTIREPGSAITHFIGCLMALIAASPLLIKAHGNATYMLAMTIFATSMVLLYAASTIYHSICHVSTKVLRNFQKLDHMMIFVLIAGTYTPVCLIVLGNSAGYRLLALVWAIAAVGILINALWISCPKWFSSCIYIAMGWICVTAFGQILSSLTPGAFGWLLAGGIIYTAGGIIYALKLPLFNSRHKNFGSHEIFHLFVMGGSFCHYMMMYGYLAAA